MDTENLRESGDEQDEQDDPDDQDEQEEQDDELDNQGNDSKQVESTVKENRTSTNRKSQKQSRVTSRSETPQNDSRSVITHPQSKRSWKSANAFINFVQDFKKDYPDMAVGRNIFQICGERWKNMTDEQKQPYIAAANTVKRLKHRKIGEVSDQQVKKSVTRVSKRKAETKRKETSQKRSKANKRDAKSNSDTDTATTTVHSSMSDADSF